MKTIHKIFLGTIFFIAVIVVLIISFFPKNPYQEEIRYNSLTLNSIQLQIPDFWKEYIEKSPTYTHQPQPNKVFEDEKDYVSMVISVDETDWNQTFLEEISTQFLNNSVSLMIAYTSFSTMFSQSDTCKIQCKQEIYDKFKIKDFSESSDIKEKFDVCVKECRDESRKFDIIDYGTSKANSVAKQTSLKDGSLFIGETIGLSCTKNEVVSVLFAIDSDRISKSKAEEVVSFVTNSIKCK